MVGVESAPNVEKTLRDAKEKYNLNPQLVVCDFSPNMLKPVESVFGKERIQIDGFHVMQELNRGIHADLLAFREVHFQAKIREFYALRDGINEIQAQFEQTKIYSKKMFSRLDSIASTSPESLLCKEFTDRVIKLLLINDYSKFQWELAKIFEDSKFESQPQFQEFCRYLMQKMPKKDFTAKGMERFKELVLKQLKTIYIKFRTVNEERSLEFFHQQWAIFFQPERLTEEREELIKELLQQYPTLAEYRTMTLQVGSIFRKNIEEITGNEIDSLVIKSNYSDKLQTAITTLKKFKQYILRFVDIFKNDPTLQKRNRSNMEPFNRRFKAPFHRGLNCTKKNHLLGKLKLQLKCDVRWLIDIPSTI